MLLEQAAAGGRAGNKLLYRAQPAAGGAHSEERKAKAQFFGGYTSCRNHRAPGQLRLSRGFREKGAASILAVAAVFRHRILGKISRRGRGSRPRGPGQSGSGRGTGDRWTCTTPPGLKQSSRCISRSLLSSSTTARSSTRAARWGDRAVSPPPEESLQPGSLGTFRLNLASGLRQGGQPVLQLFDLAVEAVVCAAGIPGR